MEQETIQYRPNLASCTPVVLLEPKRIQHHLQPPRSVPASSALGTALKRGHSHSNTSSVSSSKGGPVKRNKLGIRNYDYVEFYVGSAKSVAYWHVTALGFHLEGYLGPETGVRDRVSYFLRQNRLKLVITSPLQPEAYELHHYVTKHGLGVKRWALEVEDVEYAFQHAVDHGGIPVQTPHRLEDDHGYVSEASLKVYDDTELMLVNHDHYSGIFRPGFEAASHPWAKQSLSVGLQQIDHVVGNVRENEMELWSNYLDRVLDFEDFIYFGPGDISTRYSALLSKVVVSKDKRIKNPINEPYEGLKKSQIEEYLEHFQGSGVQHIAISTQNILHTIQALRSRGVEFIDVPEDYYRRLYEQNEKLPMDQKITEDLSLLQSYGILCDHEGDGYLLQLFTKPIGDRPTFFYEIIQRRNGAEGFGQGNFQALFESIEREQERRGNL